MAMMSVENTQTQLASSGRYLTSAEFQNKIFVISPDFFSVMGSTVEEYQSKLSVKAGISGSYELFSGSIEASFDSTDLSTKESSCISIEVCMRFETWKLQTEATEYMYPEVLEDFKTKDGKWLVEHYGGGVLMGMDIGGRWKDNIVTSKLYDHLSTKVEASMEAAYGFFLSGHGRAAVSKTVEKEKSIASHRVSVIGGTGPSIRP